jgi:hypothetical protein
MSRKCVIQTIFNKCTAITVAAIAISDYARMKNFPWQGLASNRYVFIPRLINAAALQRCILTQVKTAYGFELRMIDKAALLVANRYVCTPRTENATASRQRVVQMIFE